MTEDRAKTAALYDAINTRGDSDDFHLDLVRSADAVLDVGCGTGVLLHAARASGHTGRLVGLDPDPHALAVARRHEGVEWVEGVLGTAGYEAEFDLVVMTGHVFQVFLTDDDVRAQFTAVRRALRPGGRYAFETRNPGARAWERWTPEHRSTSPARTASGSASSTGWRTCGTAWCGSARRTAARTGRRTWWSGRPCGSPPPNRSTRCSRRAGSRWWGATAPGTARR
ncbi:SAM-dependent methyltransferase [Saccharothrix longispora]|uniref:SAM-dependent methyltransferase n=1 Tax=Saccharothrix longispora TaxID=33920 RepID=A0ABU1PYC5_9PSEU|nr:SAM-dependent methyltransferase [Saccharothrix longispora]